MVNASRRFRNRQDAGRQLAAELHYLHGAHPVVLALPRGGVPVAFEVAQALQAELDLLFVRKLGAPGHEELGIGAVVDGDDPQIVLNEEVVRQILPSPAYVKAEMHRQLAEIDRRRAEYMQGHPPVPLAGRTVILVDDGIATGGTMRAALAGLRKTKLKQLILAVPVAPSDTILHLMDLCDGIVCLYEPDPFFAVGAHYDNFDQTSDEEVINLMKAAAPFGGKHFVAQQ
jgi:putative phosphoribosyl transferase